MNNELVRGDICNSTNQDLGCPEPDDPNDPLPPVQGTGTCTNCTGGGGSGGWTPIIIDRRSGEFRLTSLDAGVAFTIDAARGRQRTSWTRRDSQLEFLWLDRNGDGIVNDASELFGSSTSLQSGAAATHGFDALRELDTNGDGHIDAADNAWPQLRLWLDANHNGVSKPGEISFLSGSGVAALELHFRTIGRRDGDGNLLRRDGV